MRAVAEHLHRRRLPIELDTDTVEPERLAHGVEIARRLGARVLRTFTHHPYGPALVEDTLTDLRAVVAVAERAGVVVALENHEEFTAVELVGLVGALDHPCLRLLFDYANSISVLEPPGATLETVQPWVAACHMKDTVMIAAQQTPEHVPAVVGVPLGQGSIDLDGLTRTLVRGGLRRFCLQNARGYHVPLGKLRPVEPNDPLLGSGAFAYTPPPFDPALIAFDPEAQLAPHELIAAERAALTAATARARQVLAATVR